MNTLTKNIEAAAPSPEELDDAMIAHYEGTHTLSIFMERSLDHQWTCPIREGTIDPPDRKQTSRSNRYERITSRIYS